MSGKISGMGKVRGTLNFIQRHKYGIVVILFVSILGFFDENSFWNRHENKKEIRMLQAEIKKYKAMYKADTEKLTELENNPQAIVKIARERYFMKMADEDVYVIEEHEKAE